MSKNGFLPADAPLEILHDGYYRPWETIIYNLPALVENGIRESISQLPLLSTDRLLSEAEWRRAYVILAFMTNAYVWGGNEPEEVCQRFLTKHQKANWRPANGDSRFSHRK